MSHILVVEDESIIRTALRKLLERKGHQIDEAATVREATQKYRLNDFDLIISDLRLPGSPGTEFISLVDDVPVLIMTSYASLRSAVESMRLGAVDYIAKPFDHDEMAAAVERIITSRKAAKPAPAPTTGNISALEGMIGSSPAMKTLYNMIHKVAPSDATVLVHGETGTGKELVARAIHEESKRAGQKLISVNCAAIPETLIEAELFGHEKGAFTGAASAREGLVAAADKGTLFLDEIGELPLEAQARLLRVLQEGEVRPIGSVESQRVDVRLVAATHRDLRKLCSEGKFREDLYYRINVVQVSLPPLRERGKDIIAIAEHLLKKFGLGHSKAPLRLSPETIQLITSYHWPGNVRELENAIQRSAILTDDQEVQHNLLGLDLELQRVSQEQEPVSSLSPYQAADTQIPHTTTKHKDPMEDLSLEDYFQRFVLEHQDSMTETELARKLGVSRKCLWERRQKFGIPRNAKSST